MDLKDILATNLRRVRNECGKTQEEMAHILGISSRYLGSIERGRVSPSVTMLGKFAAALKVEPCALIQKQFKLGKEIR